MTNSRSRKFLSSLFIVLLIVLQSCTDDDKLGIQPPKTTLNRPNVLVILVDDLGFSDIGVYGSEINTPNIDQLAKDGLQLTQFYTAATCSPTRAMLLTGVDHHLAGLGTMAGYWDENQKGMPGYEGYLNHRVITISEILKSQGYHTYMAGKWHLGKEAGYRPSDRGFEKSFALLEGGASHFSDAAPLVRGRKTNYLEDGKEVNLPEDFYSSSYYTDKLISYIEENNDDSPFFGYLAYTAVHWPIQVPNDYLMRYAGKYDSGFDLARNQRIANLKKEDLIDDEAAVLEAPLTDDWNELSPLQQRIESRKMELYAAMVANVDYHIGRLLDSLKKSGKYENTLIVVMSDNGPEGNDLEKLRDNSTWIESRFDNSLKNMGRQNSYIFYDKNWAQVSTGAFRGFKSFVNEGGIRAPAIIHYGDSLFRKGLSDEFITVSDIVPTILELTEVSHSAEGSADSAVEKPTGKSILPYLLMQVESVHGENALQGWELFGRKALRMGDWKIVQQLPPFGSGNWELFDIRTDPGETQDLSLLLPNVVDSLVLEWNEYSDRNNIVLPEKAESPYVNN